MSAEYPSPSDPRFLAVLDEIVATTSRPSIVITPTRVEALPVTASKFGGLPYLPRGAEVPSEDDELQMALLAQFRLADLPGNDFLPDTGILQFWLSRWDIFSTGDARNGPFHVVYYPQVDESVTRQEVLERYQREPGDWGFTDPEPLALAFTMTSQPVSTSDGSFDGIVEAVYRRAFPDTPSGPLDLPRDLSDTLHDRFWSEGHRLGGYPLFTQDDPRGYDNLSTEDVLLLQVDSDEYVTWGDVGVTNFFISPEDLAAADFTNVAFTWDCC